MRNKKKAPIPSPGKGDAAMAAEEQSPKVKFEIYCKEIIEKKVKQSGRSGRIYLPPEWVGKSVKVIRLD